MTKTSVDVKVRPLANPSLEKASLLGAARLYVSKDTLIALTDGLENGKPCVVERLGDAHDGGVPVPRREATLWVLPEKNISPNIVMMTRAFQEATGLRIGDQVRISLLQGGEGMPSAEEVVVRPVGEEKEKEKEAASAGETRYPAGWEFRLSLSMEYAEMVFPGMVFEGVNIGKLRRSFQVVSVNARADSIARFSLPSTTIRIVGAHEQDEAVAASAADAAATAPTGGDLVVTGVPGLRSQVDTINRFLKAFTRPFWFKDERESCGFVIHGGHGTGKTLLLQRVADTRWGRPFWIKPSDKLTTVRDTFRQARASQPCVVLIDGLGGLIYGLGEPVSRDRPNREAVVEALAEELDALSSP
ncbi:hypothetical protein E4U41_003510, partial [Claviceps citrina]